MKYRFVGTVAGLSALGLLICSLFLAGCGRSSGTRAEARLRSAVEKNPKDMDARIELAEVLLERRGRNEAIVTLQDGLRLAPNNERLLRELADIYTQWADETGSKPKYEMVARYLTQLVENGKGDAEIYKDLGYAFWWTEDYAKAAETLATALRVAPEEPEIRRSYGYVLRDSGKYEKALSELLEVSERQPDDYRIWYEIGITERYLGQYDKALGHFQKARELCPPDKRKEMDDWVYYAQRLISKKVSSRMFWTHWNLALYHKKIGRPDRAMEEFKAGLEVLPQESDQHRGHCNLEIALFYSHVGDAERSIEYTERAIEAYARKNVPKDLSFAYEHLANDYHQLARDRPDRCREFLEKTLQAHELQERFARDAGFGHMAEHALADRAKVLDELYGLDDERVKACREQMAPYIPDAGPVDNCAFASIITVEASFRLEEGDLEGARRLFEMVASYYGRSKKVEHADMGPFVFNQLAEISVRQGNIDEAIRYAERAVEKQSGIRDMLGADEFRRGVGGGNWRWSFAERLIPSALAQKDQRKAFDYFEQYKARALLELLESRSSGPARRDGLDAKRVVLARLSQIQNGVDAARSSGGDGKTLRSLERTLAVERTKYKRLTEDVSVSDRQIASTTRVESLTIEDLQPLAEEFTLVSYIIGGPSGSYAAVLSKDDVHVIGMRQVNTYTLRQAIQIFRKGLGIESAMPRDLALELDLGGRTTTDLSEDEAFELASKWLLETLVVPVFRHVKTKMVYISPDGVLNYLPFEALGAGGKYLLDRHTIVYTPSGSVLKLCMDRNRNRREKVLALGNPNLRNPAFRLIHAEDEVRGLEGLFPQVDVYVGDDATEKVVKEKGSQYDILHFACHGELNVDEPMLTSLRLAPDDENDGYLHAGEVFEYDLSASLVVLSACNSALGELSTGNELMGLTRSFLYAGVPSIIASLWTVDDRSTAYLMKEFYRNLGTMNKAEALRQAKLATKEKYPNPFHWAAFCLQGDYR